MPRLVFFAPCEKWLTSPEGAISLINLMFGASFKAAISPASGPGTLADLTLPIRWTVLTFWEKENSDEGKSWEQVVQLFSPSGNVVIQDIVPLKMEKPFHRMTVNMGHFPIGEAGQYVLKAFLRESGAEALGHEIAHATMSVSHVTPSEENV